MGAILFFFLLHRFVNVTYKCSRQITAFLQLKVSDLGYEWTDKHGETISLAHGL